MPTTSTTVALALGDALAVALLQLKGFRREDFAALHPGGSLGRKLSLRVRDVMVTEVKPLALTATMRDAVVALAAQRGLAVVAEGRRGIRNSACSPPATSLGWHRSTPTSSPSP